MGSVGPGRTCPMPVHQPTGSTPRSSPSLPMSIRFCCVSCISTPDAVLLDGSFERSGVQFFCSCFCSCFHARLVPLTPSSSPIIFFVTDHIRAGVQIDPEGAILTKLDARFGSCHTQGVMARRFKAYRDGVQGTSEYTPYKPLHTHWQSPQLSFDERQTPIPG